MIYDTEKLFRTIPQLHQCQLPTAQGPYNTTCHIHARLLLNAFVRIQIGALFVTKGQNYMYQPSMFHIFPPGELNAHDQSFS